MLNRRSFLSLSTSVIAGLAARASFAQTAVPDGYPSSYADIIEGSHAENSLLAYTSIAAEQWKPVIAAFNTLYPWIKVETLDLDGGEVIERYLAEVGTSAKTADLLVTATTDAWLNLMSRDQVTAYESPEGDVYPDWSKPIPGLYTVNVDPVYFVWNKLLLPKEMQPKSFADLVEKASANPDMFRGKISSYGAHLGSMGYTLHYTFAQGHGDKVWDWYRALGPLTQFERGSGAMMEKATSGEYLVDYFVASRTTRVALRDPGRNQVIDASLLSDGTPLLPMGVAVPKAATNVNSAKLFIDFLLSIPGQKLMPAAGRTVFHPKLTSADVDGAETYNSIIAEIGEANAWPLRYDQKLLDDRDAFLAKWKEANGL